MDPFKIKYNEIKPHTCVKRHSKVNSMSGDTPNSHKHELILFLEGRTPVQPTTPVLPPASKDVAVQSDNNRTFCPYSAAISTNERCRDEDDKGTCSPLITNSTFDDSRSSDNDRIQSVDTSPSPPKTEGTRKKLKLSKKHKGKYKITQDDEDWTVNCLYYTLQCCECTII
ncbi:unnamed protein product [Phyllotreta striolata]|uniref:Uncharacterized protein n=1 Tax=Phyllotreta striolata TaxID=444603 RepID=A0A9N9TUB0_PHYSR|nr:unnamed protein product [Phyllotreta striolata]